MSFLSIVLRLLLCTALTAVEGKFQAYWNVPLEACTKSGVHFDLDQFSIVHNNGNTFHGDKVNILYNPGLFPLYDKRNLTVNGGIPQRGNLTTHKESFIATLQEILPKDFSGPLVLDSENYLPSFNISLPSVYKKEIRDWVRSQHPHWNKEAVEAHARKTFDKEVKPYFESLLEIAVQHYPNALIGYYHYPYCHNYDYPHTKCRQKMIDLNDKLRPWLFSTSTALYPSVYAPLKYDQETRDNYLATKLRETLRLNDRNRPILPYYWYRYHDSPSFLSLEAARSLLWLVRSHNASGLMLWGSSKDLTDKETCVDFRNYLYKILGPLVKCFQEMPDSVIEAWKLKYPTEINVRLESQERSKLPKNLPERETSDPSNIDEGVDYNKILEITNAELEMEDIEEEYVLEYNKDHLMNEIYTYCKSETLG